MVEKTLELPCEPDKNFPSLSNLSLAIRLFEEFGWKCPVDIGLDDEGVLDFSSKAQFPERRDNERKKD